jgi:AcrR family transcriptional regulator
VLWQAEVGLYAISPGMVDLEREKGELPGLADFHAVHEHTRAVPNELGLRERHKIDKLDRITNATQELFGRLGYDGTTLREIADKSGIALGTLGLYATDKRDLILLLFNRNIPLLMRAGWAKVSPSNTLEANMLAFFEPFYRAYAKDLTLYRIILNHGQLANQSAGNRTQEFVRIRVALLASLVEIIMQARAKGECSADGDAQLHARSFYNLYFAAVRWWIYTPEPKVKAGLAELKALFALHIRGLKQ